MNQDKPKSTIEFKLTPKTKPSLKLLRHCILDEMPKDYGRTDLAKTQVLLKAYPGFTFQVDANVNPDFLKL